MPYQRRAYVAATDNYGSSSCCVALWNSQLYPRVVNASGAYVVVGMLLPKLTFDSFPHSPFAATIVKLHSGTKSPLLSVHDRVAFSAMFAAGFASRVKLVRLGPSRYRPMLALSAVLPLPNRSNAPPSRGDTFFQSGALSASGKIALRPGTSGPGPLVSAGT